MRDFCERFKDFFDSLNESQKATVIREYNDANNYCHVYDMEDFDFIMGNKSPMEIVSKCCYVDFNPSHSYFRCDANDCFQSSDDVCEWTDSDDMAGWYKDNDYILVRLNVGWEEDEDEDEE